MLLLSCGANAPWLIAKTLRVKFPLAFRLIGTDTNPKELVAAAGLLDAFYTVPPSNTPDFLPSIEKIIVKERPDYIWPLFDFDQLALSSDSEMLRRYGVTSLATPVETLKVYKDKCLMHAACRRTGIPVPRRYRQSQARDAIGSVSPCRRNTGLIPYQVILVSLPSERSAVSRRWSRVRPCETFVDAFLSCPRLEDGDELDIRRDRSDCGREISL